MSNVLDRLPAGSKVAIIRLRSLGDCVLTTPAIEVLKRHRPDLQIAVVVEDRFARLFGLNPDVATTLPPSVASVAAWGAKLCLNFHGGTRSLVFTAASRAGVRAGFAHFRGTPVYNIRIPRAQEILGEERVVHTAEHLASAMFYLGVPRVEIPRAKLFAPRKKTAGPYAVIHAVASAPDKAWAAEGFLAAAGRLKQLEPVFIGGPEDDLTPFAKYRTVAKATLEETMSLIQGASLFVGNDSGPAHIAAAFGVPLVALYGPSDEAVWAPWRANAVVVSGRGSMANIDEAQVMAAIERLGAAV
jgi:heptosyltransferase-3